MDIDLGYCKMRRNQINTITVHSPPARPAAPATTVGHAFLASRPALPPARAAAGVTFPRCNSAKEIHSGNLRQGFALLVGDSLILYIDPVEDAHAASRYAMLGKRCGSSSIPAVMNECTVLLCFALYYSYCKCAPQSSPGIFGTSKVSRQTWGT